jgi:DNA-binding GntR family transcriptional regulator
VSQRVEATEPTVADRNRLTAETYATLRNAITSGEFLPRERPCENVLARRFGMSRTLGREALQRLKTLVEPLKAARS